MGVAYAAHDDRLDRPVAIKVVRPDALVDSAALTRFRREARAAARISHPHICPLYELGEHGDQPFLVMELLEGESLPARIDRGAVPVKEGFEISEQILDALASLHRSGILHRDLKPANVFLTPHGVKLLDFGLAHPIAIGDTTHEVALTGQGMMVGTPQYMSTERLFWRAATSAPTFGRPRQSSTRCFSDARRSPAGLCLRSSMPSPTKNRRRSVRRRSCWLSIARFAPRS